LDLARGDCVEVFIAPSKSVFEAAFLFILPLALFIAAYLIARYLFSANENICFFAGLSGVFAGFLINYVRKLVIKNTDLPEIVKKLQFKGSIENNAE